MTGVRFSRGASARDRFSPLLVPDFGYTRHYARDAAIVPPVADWQPPAELRHLHRAAFVQAFWRRLQGQVANPVQVDNSLGVRRGQVLSGGVFEFGPDGRIATSIWRYPLGAAPQRIAVAPERIAIDGVPFRWHWLDEVIFEGFVTEYLDAFGSEERPGLDAYARWLFDRFRRAREWHAWRRARMIHRTAWTTPFRRTYAGALEVVALSSAFELWKEAWCMHHCVDKFADRCAKGGLLIVSIRKTGRTRPLATAALRCDDGAWSLEAITGFANARPVEEAVRAAFEVLDRLNERVAAAAELRSPSP